MSTGTTSLPSSALRSAWEFTATGTRWRLYHDGSLPAEVAEAVVAAIRIDEERWSRFRPDSELSAINSSAGHWTVVSPETFDLLRACVGWTERTGGVFNPLAGLALRAWGYEGSFATQAPERQRSPRPSPVTAAIELDASGRRVRVPSGAQLDLGGIGKGWIAARIADLITRRAPHEHVLIDAGGDLLAVTGEHRAAVESVQAEGPAVIGFVTLAAGDAVATSGFSRRQWVNHDGRSAHHLIDPHIGSPGPRVHATVIAKDPVTADVIAKVLALRPDSIEQCRHPALIQFNDTFVASPLWRLAAYRPCSSVVHAASRQ